MTTMNILNQLLQLAADAGRPLCLCCLIESTDQAGSYERAPSDEDGRDLSSVQVAAVELLLREASMRRIRVLDGLDHDGAARRVRVAAQITSQLLPPTTVDLQGRFAVTLDDDGHLPEPADLEYQLEAAVSALRYYVDEHDQGRWVSPDEVSGAVADLHDSARVLTTVLELQP